MCRKYGRNLYERPKSLSHTSFVKIIEKQPHENGLFFYANYTLINSTCYLLYFLLSFLLRPKISKPAGRQAGKGAETYDGMGFGGTLITLCTAVLPAKDYYNNHCIVKTV